MFDLGPAVYLASKIWPIEEEREKLVEAAEKQLDYILHKAPRDKQGAISHRTEKISYWVRTIFKLMTSAKTLIKLVRFCLYDTTINFICWCT